MFNNQTTYQTWIRLAGITGTASVLSYFGAVFLPVPDFIGMLLVFAFGPLLCVSILGMYRFMANHHDGPILQISCVFGIIAGVVLTSMLVLQVGNNMIRAELLSSAETDAAKESIKMVWAGVNRSQFLLDVVWDIFICISLILLGIVMLEHPNYGKIWGFPGIVIGFLLLAFNLYAFPYPPAESGSFDLGPLAALWMLSIYIRALFIK